MNRSCPIKRLISRLSIKRQFKKDARPLKLMKKEVAYGRGSNTGLAR